METNTAKFPVKILLADDDTDDCFFFEKALNEIPAVTNLTIVHNGEALMDYLFQNLDNLPDVIFLDLSMPRKTGFECLAEINENEMLKDIPIMVFTTSFSRGIDFEMNLINMLMMIGAKEYIRKPSDFEQLKEIIQNSLKKLKVWNLPLDTTLLP